MSTYIDTLTDPSQAKTSPAATTYLLGLGTAIPANRGENAAACAFMERTLSASGDATPGALALLRRIYSKSGIEARYTVLPDYLQPNPADHTFFPTNESLEPFPGTAARMDVYERESVPLARDAALRALTDAGIHPTRVTHLVISTCTGFFAHGPDVLLLRELGLRPDVQRTTLGFMGCHAGLSGLRICDDIARANPDAVILQIAIELCSLHYQKTPTPVTMVANALFADGAAAALYAASPTASTGAPLACIRATRCTLGGDSLERMSWRIGNNGFVMTLDAELPALLQSWAPDYLTDLAAQADATPADITSYAIHPGGRKILEAVGTCLDLTPEDLQSSYNILRDYGNMSSATILFVLNEELRRDDRQPGLLAAMAFGPGLTIEGCLLERP